MKFTIKKEKLLQILQKASKAISPLVPYPYLKGILINIKNDYIEFITTDIHLSIKTTIKNKDNFSVEEEGKILLDEKMISDITSKIDSEEITFESIEGDSIAVYGGNSKYKLSILSFEKYPEIEFGSNNKRFKVNSCILKTIVEKTAYACSEKEIQLNLTGINLFSKDGKLHAYATDRYKLASKEFDLKLDEEFNIVVPKKYFILAMQCIDQNEIEFEISKKKKEVLNNDSKTEVVINELILYSDESIIQVELIEDLFPNVNPIFNFSNLGILIVKKNELIKMIDRCSLIRDDKNKTAITLKIENNKLNISSHNNISSSNEILDIVSYEGEEISIIYDSKFFIDSLKVLDTENIKIIFTKEKKAAILKNIDDESLVLVVSPQKA